MAIEDQQLVATDEMIVDRDKLSRNIVLGAYVLILPLILVPLGAKVTGDWFGTKELGMFLGLIGASLLLGMTINKFLIRNKSLHAFVTVDLLQSFLQGGKERVYVSYGPGMHAAFPWESRSADNNVSLKEADQDFNLTVQCLTGIVKVKGSLRMRPDIRHLVPFLSGVAVMAEDVTDLVKSFIIEFLAKEDVDSALKGIERWNTELNKKFGLASNGVSARDATANKDPHVSDFERRFGVNIGDVTIAEILPSEEAQKTRSAIDEATVIARGTAIILGMTETELSEALKIGALSHDQVARARREFMAASDNIEMNLDANEYTFKLEGDPELIKGLGSLGPVLSAYFQAQQKSGSKKSRK